MRGFLKGLVPARLRRWRQLMGYYRRESADLAELAPGPLARAWLALVRVLLGLKAALPARALRGTAIPVRVAPGRVYLSHWCDLLVLGEIYKAPREYEFEQLPPSARTIVDLGANVGFSARYLSERYPQARVIAYEPDPEVLRIARRNLAERPAVTLRNLAVAGAAGTLELNRFDGGSWGNSMYVTSQDVAETFTVPAVTLDAIIAEVGEIDILKIDIEGAEHDVLRASRSLERVGCIVGEVHPAPGRSGESVFDLLPGFDVVASAVRGGQGPFLALRRDRP